MTDLSLSAIQLRRFFQIRSSRISVYTLSALLLVLACSEFIANDRPLVIYYQGSWYFPLFVTYPETTFGGAFKTEAHYRTPFIRQAINKRGWFIMPPIPYRYDTHDFSAYIPQPEPPSWRHYLGTDDQARDIAARILYGLRISVVFGLLLTALSLGLGVFFGAVCGYYGGLLDLILQRFLEVWSGLPTLYLLIILSSFMQPNFFLLLGVMLLFSWTRFVGVIRAEFLRARTMPYVASARALGVRDYRIIVHHILPNAFVATLSLLPWHIIGGIMSLTSLDFLGFGMPIGSASLGELVSQAKSNLHAPWIGLSVFVTLLLILGLLVFIGEGIRDTLDPHSRDVVYE